MTHFPRLDITALLKQYNIHPRKGMGQNFLVDDVYLQQIVTTADIQPADIVLEIGPGLGNLTRHLALAADSVIAVELDRTLFPVLASVLSPYKNVHLVQGDILRQNLSTLISSPGYLVVANIPYNITSAVIRHLLEGIPRPRRLVLTIQEEVAHRICAQPGELSLLALSVQVYGHPEVRALIPSTAFIPSPKVNSAILCVDVFNESAIPAFLLKSFFALAKAGFSQKRKTLRNSLSAGMGISSSEATVLLSNSGIDPGRRAETLSIQEWRELSVQYSAGK